MLKRVFDVAASSVGLVILSPLFVTIAIAIKLDSKGPVFYRARRVGKGGKEFWLYKFRSMVVDADKTGSGITSAHDKRITRVGRFLRQRKLDELPQLINVVRAEMSLVGPRPEDPRYVALYTSQQHVILNYRPGITSAASLRYRDEEQQLLGTEWERAYIEHIMPTKIYLDLEYLERATLLTDVALILHTVFS